MTDDLPEVIHVGTVELRRLSTKSDVWQSDDRGIYVIDDGDDLGRRRNRWRAAIEWYDHQVSVEADGATMYEAIDALHKKIRATQQLLAKVLP